MLTSPSVSRPDTRRIALALEYPLMQQGGTEVTVRVLLQGLAADHEIVLVSADKGMEDLPGEYAKLIQQHLCWRPLEGVEEMQGVGGQIRRERLEAAVRKQHGEQRARALAERLRQERVQLAHFQFGGTFAWQSNRYWRCPVYHLARSGVPCLSTNQLGTQWLEYDGDPARPRWQRHLLQIMAILSRSVLYRRLRAEVAVSKHDQKRLRAMFPIFRAKILQFYHSRNFPEPAAKARPLTPALSPSEGERENCGPAEVEPVDGHNARAEHVRALQTQAGVSPPQTASRDLVVLTVGHIARRKGQAVLAEAFARISSRYPDWRLCLAGPVQEPECKELIEELAARCARPGQISLLGQRSDAGELMQRAAVFVQPSFNEGLPMALQEALFHGCPVVGTRVGGIPELIDDEVNGLLVPPGDASALSQVLDRLMSDQHLRERLAAQSRPSVLRKGMTAAMMVENYRRLYQRCTSAGV